MVETYWNVGKQIFEAQGNAGRAEYGAGLLNFLSEKLIKEFGKGFTVTNLKYMRQFYITFPNRHALRDQLSWTHYRFLLKVENDVARTFYLDECAKSNWSTRQLERQINSFYYQRLLSSQDKDSVQNEIQTLENITYSPSKWTYGLFSLPLRLFIFKTVPGMPSIRLLMLPVFL